MEYKLCSLDLFHENVDKYNLSYSLFTDSHNRAFYLSLPYKGIVFKTRRFISAESLFKAEISRIDKFLKNI